jgi:mannosylglycerate hydrolase MGH1-like protein
MDNSPRNAYLKNGGMGVDISSEMVLFARQLGEIAVTLGKDTEAREYPAQADQLASVINQRLWDGTRKFDFDMMQAYSCDDDRCVLDAAGRGHLPLSRRQIWLRSSIIPRLLAHTFSIKAFL